MLIVSENFRRTRFGDSAELTGLILTKNKLRALFNYFGLLAFTRYWLRGGRFACYALQIFKLLHTGSILLACFFCAALQFSRLPVLYLQRLQSICTGLEHWRIDRHLGGILGVPCPGLDAPVSGSSRRLVAIVTALDQRPKIQDPRPTTFGNDKQRNITNSQEGPNRARR